MLSDTVYFGLAFFPFCLTLINEYEFKEGKAWDSFQSAFASHSCSAGDLDLEPKAGGIRT